MKKKICFVVQRYGLEVNGGAELHCRQLAEKMRDRYDVSVFTTKAVDYMTWNNEYPADVEEINGVTVHRFPVEHPRVQREFDAINGRFLRGEFRDLHEEEAWFEAQGPYTPKLIAALEEHRNDYDVFIFFTYLYYTSAYGLPVVGEKSVFIPTAHDEPFLRMHRFEKVFHAPRAFFYNTEEERRMIHKKFHNEAIPSELGGVGVDLPDDVDAARFCAKYNLGNTPYVVYVGRIDEGKNCHEMFRYWKAYKERNPGPLKLVLMGKPVIPVPERDDICSLGFVDEQDKFDGMKGAQFLWLPSQFESLSMVVLESLLLGVPVLVNGKCEVLRGHCHKSNAGLYYENYLEFELATNRLLNDPAMWQAMSALAPGYVQRNYQWNVIVERLSTLIERSIG